MRKFLMDTMSGEMERRFCFWGWMENHVPIRVEWPGV